MWNSGRGALLAAGFDVHKGVHKQGTVIHILHRDNRFPQIFASHQQLIRFFLHSLFFI